MSPLKLFISEVPKPKIFEATTGTSQALDSMITLPKPSLLLGRQYISQIL